MTIALSLYLCLLAEISVELTPTAGAVRVAELNHLTDGQITFTTDGQEETLPTEQLRRVQFQAADQSNSDAIHVTLVDGSTFAISDFQQLGLELTVKSQAFPSVALLPKKSVKSILIQQLLNDAQMAQWRNWDAAPAAADMLVLQRKDKQLQAIEGVISSIDDANVNFIFDGDTIEVKRSRVVGMFFFTGQAARLPSARAQLVTVDGAQLQVAALVSQDHELQIKTLSGFDVTLPFEKLRYLDFATVSTAYLSDLTPEQTRFTPYLEIPILSNLETKWFEPQKDRQLSRSALELPASPGKLQLFAKGLGVHSRTELVYRLAGDYRRFQAIVGMSQPEGVGAAELIILLDGKESRRIPLFAMGDNVPLDVDVTGTNRLTILVDYGEGIDNGDHVSLCDARLVK